MEVDSRIFSSTIGLSTGIEIETGSIIEIDPETVTDKTIGETTIHLMRDKLPIDKTVEETAIDKTIEIGKIIDKMTPY